MRDGFSDKKQSIFILNLIYFKIILDEHRGGEGV